MWRSWSGDDLCGARGVDLCGACGVNLCGAR